MSKSKLKVGTRGSQLALYQTSLVIDALSSRNVAATPEIIKTRGDVDTRAFTEISGDGFFTKELERALLDKKIQFAVHSCKDLPSQTHSQLPWIAFGEREDFTDVLISRKGLAIKKIGTSSPRRTAQITSLGKNLQIDNLRGNVPTRIEKLARGDYDAIIIAKAGLMRLNLWGAVKTQFEVKELSWTTAPAQGVLAVQTHKTHIEILKKIANPGLDYIVKSEKTLLALLGGGCHLALGVHLQKKIAYELKVFVSSQGVNLDKVYSSTRVGDAVRDFANDFIGAKPAPRVWITQPLQNLLNSARTCVGHDLFPVLWPLLEITPSWMPTEIQNRLASKKIFAVVFTSQLAVPIFVNEVSSRLDLNKWLKGKKVYAVGNSTKNKLAEYQIGDVAVANEANAEALVTMLQKQAGQILLPGSAHTHLAKLLPTEQLLPLTLYEMRRSEAALTQDVPKVERGDAIVITSPSAVREFVLWCSRNPELRRLSVWAFGPTTSRELDRLEVEHNTNPKSGSWDDQFEAIKNGIRTVKKMV